MKPRYAKTWEEAFDMQEKFDDKPTCFVQWKGTDVCMDVHCKCGAHGHIDGSFTYQVQCLHCKAIYHVGCFVELIELEKANPNAVGPIPFWDKTMEKNDDSN